MTLSPDEIRNASATMLTHAIKDILPSLPGRDFPQATCAELVRRRAMLHITSPRDFVEVIWPFPSSPNSDFDPLEARLRHECSELSAETKVELASNMIVKDFMAAHMSQKAAGAQHLVELVAALDDHGFAHSQAAECGRAKECASDTSQKAWDCVIDAAAAVAASARGRPPGQF